jgi:hypothetical protein
MPHGRKQCPCELPIKEQIKVFSPIIQNISKAKTLKEKKNIFKKQSKCLTKFLSECSGAILREDIKLPNYKPLKKHKTALLQLADPSIKLKEKSQLFENKKGGFLTTLLPILGGILANTVLPLIINKIRGK